MKISELQASNPGLYNTDKFSSHSYDKFYDELFSGRENDELNILEIGVNEGGSVRLWHDYLTRSRVTGIDICCNWSLPDKADYPRLDLHRDDAYDDRFARELSLRKHLEYENWRGFDAIVEDGSHLLEHQIYTLEHFPALLESGGILIIEDVPEGAEQELIKHAPSGGKFWIENLRHIKGRWDDCLVIFKKD